MDITTSTFRAPPSKLNAIATLLDPTTTLNTRRPARKLAVLAGKAQYFYLAISAARFNLRELRNILATQT
jgi:hypothetical protein